MMTCLGSLPGPPAAVIDGESRREHKPLAATDADTLTKDVVVGTLYAIQDIEDDALVGVKSSARRLGEMAPLGVGIFYTIALILWGAAIWTVRPDWLAVATLAPGAVHLANQALRADPRDGELALRLFRSNRTCGLLLFLAMLVVGLSSR